MKSQMVDTWTIDKVIIVHGVNRINIVYSLEARFLISEPSLQMVLLCTDST